MKELVEFVRNHTRTGQCACADCLDKPVDQRVFAHTVSLGFFEVSATDNPDPKQLEDLVKANVTGNFCNVNIYDGEPHMYIELGVWIGDQGLAMALMGLGKILGLWELALPPGVAAPNPIISTNKELMELVFGEYIAKPPVQVAHAS